MAEINVLSKELSELIAAGEVIERPASVIKELVENSIDAGASHITVEIKNGGSTFMRIVDDGKGIAEDDIATAFLRHATSKISDKSDLDSIMTLGFRGEALASIAAVARVEVLSKQKNQEYGVHYIIEGTVEKLKEKAGCPDGTTIIIRDLFFNVPARQKFMKKDVTEANAISSIIQKIALSHPEISFKMIRDNKFEFNSSGDESLFSSIYAVYGKALANDMLKVDYSDNGIRVHGYTVKPLYAKHNRSFQNFFVNGRYIKSLTCSLALEEAYKTLIMVGKFPACVLKLDIPPSIVDVNVHPAKIEVRFSDEKLIFNTIFFAVKNALMSSGLIYDFQLPEKNEPSAASVSTQQQQNFVQNSVNVSKNNPIQAYTYYNNNPDKPKTTTYASDNSLLINAEDDENFDGPDITEYAETSPINNGINAISDKPVISQTAPTASIPSQTQSPEPESSIRVIGEAFLNYIIAEADDNIIIMDKHAAHERVIYEKLKNNSENHNSQYLMTPCEILLPINEFDAVQSNLNILEQMGFKLDLSNKPCISALAIPVFLQNLDMDEILPEIAQNIYLNMVDPQTNKLDHMLHTMACKAAIKANDKNSISELQSLAEQVYFNENIRHCPHGRPIIFTISKKELQKQFGRE